MRPGLCELRCPYLSEDRFTYAFVQKASSGSIRDISSSTNIFGLPGAITGPKMAISTAGLKTTHPPLSFPGGAIETVSPLAFLNEFCQSASLFFPTSVSRTQTLSSIPSTAFISVSFDFRYM